MALFRDAANASVQPRHQGTAHDSALPEGEQRGKVEVVEGLLRTEVTWEVIEAATGLNESAFQALKEQLSASEV